MGIRLALGLILTSIPAAAAIGADASICDDADHCVWIMENHGPHEFDYEVLTRELEGFGTDGKSFLIMLVGDKDADIAGRAIDILSEGKFTFSREEARKIVSEWPGSNMEKMANLMVKIGSPDVQGRMIESLLSDDPKIQKVARDVLARLRENKKIYQLRPFEHGPLAKAVAASPTRELVQMLAAFPADKTRPFLQRALYSPDGPSVIAAYDGLYAIDKELAFRSLLETLKKLGPEQAETAFAIGELLRHRNKRRPDGFYIQFAKELAEDPEMTLMGRVAGLDAVLGGGAFKADGKVTGLDSTPAVRSALRAALQARGDDIYPYESNFDRVFQNDKAYWAISIWNHIRDNQQRNGSIYQGFFKRLERLDDNVVQRISLQALSQGENIKILEYALASARSQKDPIYLTSVERIGAHWSDDLRYNAMSTAKIIKAAQTGATTPVVFEKTYTQLRNADRKRWRSCKINGKTVTDYVVQLPYFTLEEEVNGSFVKRRFIESAYPTQQGWFVGFSAPNSGGLRYYDNETGLGDPVKPDQVSSVAAVMPIQIPRPGQYASDFWVISADQNQKDDGQLFIASKNQNGIQARLSRYLPRAEFDVSILPKGGYLLTHKTHSPLILGVDGTLKPACE